MIKGLYTAASGMIPQAQKLEIIANNMANINATGFKKENAFVELMKDSGTRLAEGGTEPVPVNIKAYTDFSDGSFNQTNNRLDCAIQGRGFFAVETPQGVRYTRNGNFMLSVDGTVVTNEGHPVLGEGGRIVLPDLHRLASGDLAISEAGEIVLDRRIIAKLRIADFDDLSGLDKEGHSLFSAKVPERSANAGKDAIVRQGFLEESNVNGVEEMIMMIEISRNFETEQKSIQMQDSTLDQAMSVGRGA